MVYPQNFDFNQKLTELLLNCCPFQIIISYPYSPNIIVVLFIFAYFPGHINYIHIHIYIPTSLYKHAEINTA